MAFWHSSLQRSRSLYLFAKVRGNKVLSSRAKQGLRLSLGIAIAIASSWLALRNVQFGEVAEALSRTDYLLLAPAIGAIILSLYVKALRWRLLFSPHYRPRPNSLFSALLIGLFANNVLPIRVGELIRVGLIGESEKVSRAFALSTVITEKTIDSLTLLLIMVVLMPLVPLPSWLQRSALVGGIVALVILLALVLTARSKSGLLSPIDSLLQRLPVLNRLPLSAKLRTAAKSLDVLNDGPVLLKIAGLTFVAYLLGILANLFTLMALNVSVPLTASLLILLIGYLGGAVPSTPGKIGIFHYLTMLALVPFAVDKELALSFSFVLHLVVFVPPTLLAVGYIWKENIRFRKPSTVVEEAA